MIIMRDIDTKLKKIIMDQANLICKNVCISESTNLIYGLGFDSISLVNLILEIENEFNVEIDNYDLDVICEYGTLFKMVVHILDEQEIK